MLLHASKPGLPYRSIPSRIAAAKRAIESIADRTRTTSGAVDTGWGEELARGVIHEWLGPEGDARRDWTPALSILAHLAARALESDPGGRVVWIGRRCRPYPPALAAIHPLLLRRSVLVDPPDAGTRLWSIDAALRCPAIAAVVADGSGLDLGATRRLQLAGAAGRVLALVARPGDEVHELSAAATRWLVRRRFSESGRPGWTVELLRRKGVRPVREPGRRDALEWDDASGAVVVPADVVRRSGAPPVVAGISRGRGVLRTA